MKPKSNKTIALEFYRKIIRDLDLALVENYIKEGYIQHSPIVKDGREGILTMLGFLKSMPKTGELSPSPIVRLIADGDFVAVHLDLKFMGKKMAVIDFYRLENGKLAEHWDVTQMQPDYGESAITMTNGTAVIEDVDTEGSKRVIRKFYDEVLIPRNPGGAGEFLTPGFIEHHVASGLLNGSNSETRVHKIIGEGNFVLSQCECKSGDKVIARYNIFKLEDDKIAERWSVEQDVPDEMAHGNGMF